MQPDVTSEFDLISHFFAPLQLSQDFVRLGQGDDCALFAPSSGLECAVSTDTLVSGVHFLPDMAPEALGHRALAVSLSDLAAMGATPRACTLALTLPKVDHQWLTGFSQGFGALAHRVGVSLMGGDTTRGPLSITVTVFGEVRASDALRRSGAREKQHLWVSGCLGAAWYGLMTLLPAAHLVTARSVTAHSVTAHSVTAQPVTGHSGTVQRPDWIELDRTARLAFERPEPRLALGEQLLGLATAAIDISDGLASDAGHIAKASGVSLQIDCERVPIFSQLKAHAPNRFLALKHACTGGDDYELLFTAPQESDKQIMMLGQKLGLALTQIGHVLPQAQSPVCYLSSDEHLVEQIHNDQWAGFMHFG